MIIITLYNVVDTIWITGLGGNAIAGVSATNSLYTVLIGISGGLAVGATSAIGYM